MSISFQETPRAEIGILARRSPGLTSQLWMMDPAVPPMRNDSQSVIVPLRPSSTVFQPLSSGGPVGAHALSVSGAPGGSQAAPQQHQATEASQRAMPFLRPTFPQPVATPLQHPASLPQQNPSNADPSANVPPHLYHGDQPAALPSPGPASLGGSDGLPFASPIKDGVRVYAEDPASTPTLRSASAAPSSADQSPQLSPVASVLEADVSGLPLNPQPESLGTGRVELVRQMYQPSPEDSGPEVDEDGNPICPICLDALDTSDAVATSCYHWFHRECAKESEKVSLQSQLLWPCPACRHPVTYLRTSSTTFKAVEESPMLAEEDQSADASLAGMQDEESQAVPSAQSSSAELVSSESSAMEPETELTSAQPHLAAEGRTIETRVGSSGDAASGNITSNTGCPELRRQDSTFGPHPQTKGELNTLPVSEEEENLTQHLKKRPALTSQILLHLLATSTWFLGVRLEDEESEHSGRTGSSVSQRQRLAPAVVAVQLDDEVLKLKDDIEDYFDPQTVYMVVPGSSWQVSQKGMFFLMLAAILAGALMGLLVVLSL